ncbi:HAD-IIA family hydrolase [Amnibacterium kyonggiense]|uniref:HAD superfamily hydrolase (TIGR01450 family) n=1 Tax=Amnibacterium kyonggiense TaxID=595671 RepID=A0A4R7FKA0_9MICO|nr:HAD-IIA family hydrolase [Amnibacterium kyonggiense]TDS76765.1 HAD superfamily hydrolase (TIGR01450 family) [Amnibacterium kyonggiense]
MARSTPLGDADTLLLDLDGVVYRGSGAVAHAAASLEAVRARGVRVGYITNNASRTAATVAEQLTSLGMAAEADDVVTSPQAAVRLLADRLPAGARVLVIGGIGLRSVVEEAGFVVAASADDAPDAVVQGFAPELGWKDLAEASFALADPDRLWVATNTDWTIPVDRGIAPGNGTLVSAVHAAVGRLPIVAGKPETPLFETAVERFGARRAFFVGDRLDTDVKGANAAGMPSALVLTGIDGPKELLAAPPDSRPGFVLADLRGLLEPYPEVKRRGDGVQVGKAIARIRGVELEVVREGEPIDLIRAVAAAVWSSGVGVYALRIPEAVLRLRASLR